jgi:competence protein ComEA
MHSAPDRTFGPMPRRRGPEPEVRDRARSRLASLQPRTGWVPRVPGPGPTAPGESGEESWPAADAWFGPLPAAADRSAGPAAGVGRSAAWVDHPTGEDPGGEHPDSGLVVDGDLPRETHHGQALRRPGGRHRGDAVADRMPLAVRAALARSVPDSVREGRVGLGAGQAVVVLLLALLALGGAALVVLVSRPDVEPAPALAPVPEASGTPVPQPGAAPVTALPPPPAAGPVTPAAGGGADLVVHVAGEVARPGVVRLPPGSRVVDAIAAAGGAEEGVDLTPLNLARPLSDGEQVLVGVDPPPGGDTHTGVGGAGPAAPSDAGPADARVDLNTATAAQLEELPGVGPVLAGRILAWREEHGRFTSADELREVSGIGPKTYEALADLVRV